MSKVTSTFDTKLCINLADKAMSSGLKAMSERVSDKAKSLCPVDTGKLKNSIHVEDNTVIAEAEYAVYVEHKQPFIEPALYTTPITDVIEAVKEVF